MIALGLYHDAFEVSGLVDPQQILCAQAPERKRCRIFRWKESKLDEPIFREPERSSGPSCASVAVPTPLRGPTARRWLSRLGREAGLEDPLSQSCIRRATGNSVDGTSSRHPTLSHRLTKSL